MATLDEDRNEVRHQLLEAERLLSGDDPEATASNAATAKMEAIAARHDAAGHLVELLAPLLAEAEDKQVRFGAATFLLSRGHADLAVPVLETIDVLEASIVLAQWRRRQQPGTA
ncbi:hypothetical protein [Microlunatus parietis]|uniref:HEAT repeat-containing protein n=1 Tax=Microlunatus parietis TaxID=682979 RepID=A0A7Y9I959_9ACTN|nr:hypothetical protein [Microlunatus parietis]NYE72507.1 hypothetical protein [Microlunatus parietis]